MAALLKLGASKKVAAVLILISLTAASIAAFKSVSASSRTITVPDDYSTITAAVEIARDGDTIFVRKGRYEGPINQTLVINKSISLIGEDANNTILNLYPRWIESTLPFTLSYYDDAIRIEASDVRLIGFTIASVGGSLHVTGVRNQVTGNIVAVSLFISGSNQNVSQNTVTHGIGCYGSCNIVAGNNITGYGIVVGVGGVSNMIYGNTIADCNTETAGYGIRLDDGENTVFKNSIKNCSHALSILGESGSNNIYSNMVTNNIGGLEIFGQGSNNAFHGNYVANNHYGVLISYTFMRSPGQNNTVYHNNFVRNTAQVNTDGTYQGNYGDIVSTYHSGWFDNGKEGNYWSDYKGIDINGDGIGDTPYVIDANRQDNYPLMVSVDVSSVSTELPDLASPSPSPSPSPNPGPSSTTTIVAFAVSAAVVVVGLLLYFRKRVN